jgi:hypothetical protein
MVWTGLDTGRPRKGQQSQVHPGFLWLPVTGELSHCDDEAAGRLSTRRVIK